MAMRLSRRKIAGFVAERLLSGTSTRVVLREVGAYLIDTGRVREATLLVRDIEDALAERGIVVADVTSARPLDQTLLKEITSLVGGTSVELREHIDASVLGGVRVDTPGKRFDGTIQHKLTALRAKQL